MSTSGSDSQLDGPAAATKPIKQDNASSSTSNKSSTEKPPSSATATKNKKNASLSDTLSFVFRCGPSTQLLFAGGVVGGICHGLTWPMLAYFMSQTLQTLSGISGGAAVAIDINADPMADVRQISYIFLLLGLYSLVTAFCQNFFFQLAAARASRLLQREWFHALLLKDMAFWDTHAHVSGMASTIVICAGSYRRGLGSKFGETIQNLTTGIAGLLLGLFSSWQTALLIFCILPFVTAATFRGMQLNRTKSVRAAEFYQQAGSIAMTTLTALRTVLSLNAVEARVKAYKAATQAALDSAISVLLPCGFWNGAMLGVIIGLFCLVVLFGSFLMYRDVGETGCDPGGRHGTGPCPTTGADIFGAMMGIMFAAQALSRLGNCLEGFTDARVAVAEALEVIDDLASTPDDNKGKLEEKSYEPTNDNTNTNTDQQMADAEEGKSRQPSSQSIVPYDPFSVTSGIRPQSVQGAIEMQNLTFAYPSRPEHPILKNFSIKIPAGKTVALVGPSGGGKSTVLGLIERYYTPSQGQILLDGTNIQHLNLQAYRQSIGYVAQEPVLFAASIRDNIAHGSTKKGSAVTQQEIEQAAKQANAHDFIMSFPEGYDTNVGHKGAQLSGGEKQRVAMSRVLVSNPSILLLDEATSALDSQSEQIVQAALDHIVEEQARTTIIVAHRLSTIRNADIIFVIAGGQVVEQGTHDELLGHKAGHYRQLVEAQEGPMTESIATITTAGESFSVKNGDSHTLEVDVDAIQQQFNDSLFSVDVDDIAPDGSFVAGARESYVARQSYVPPPVVAAAETGQQIPLIRFKNVTFSYPARPTKTIFQNFNLDLMPGETVALVGPSGSGKSTTVALLERFYDPDSGVVEYKGNDITKLNVHWYRDQIGYVGQEPTLFPGTIAENIALGASSDSDASREAIEEAAKQANAHDFIMSFPHGYDTDVGELGTQVSGGQKQRIAIARAMIKKPQTLILDEATSALDNESEKIVQEALSKLMQSHNYTTLVIAHKLSTVRDADRIAFVKDGAVLEIGSHDELMAKKSGHYRGLVKAQKRDTSMDESHMDESGMDASKRGEKEENEEETGKDMSVMSSMFMEAAPEKEDVFNPARIKQLAAPNLRYILSGCVGALLIGSSYPFLGMLFAGTIDVFYYTVRPCPSPIPSFEPMYGFDSCEEYWEDAAERMQSRSFEVATYYFLLVLLGFAGAMLSYWSFGHASERLTKKIRDDTFTALVRLPPAYHDTHNIGKLLSALGEDTARLHAFAGTPLRQFLEAITAVFIGILVSFAFMWPSALMSIVCFVPLSFAARLTRSQVAAKDEAVLVHKEDANPNSPGSILSETLLNIRTIAALTLETKMFDAFNKAILAGDDNVLRESARLAFMSGLGFCLQRFSNALMYFWGGYLLVHYPETFGFKDFMISQFTFILSVLGLGAALQDLDNRQEVQECAVRVFKILDRQSTIDPLSEEGKKLESNSVIMKA